jgi:rhodanese-related sulfurtransferase
MQPIDAASLHTRRSELLIVDLRDDRPQWIAGSDAMTASELGRRYGELLRRGPICFVCEDGINSATAASAVGRLGPETYFLEGGVRAWASAQLPLEGAPPAPPTPITKGALPTRTETPALTVLVERAATIAGSWLAPQDLEQGLPDAEGVLAAWYRSGHFDAADRPARVATLVTSHREAAAIVVWVDVEDHDDIWSTSLVWAQDRARAVLIGIPADELDTLLGPGTRRFEPLDEVVLGHG